MLSGDPLTICPLKSEQAVVEGTDLKAGLVRWCTFHPAYGYEDFIEGFRPQINATNQLVFERCAGIFKTLCKDAHVSERKHFLVVDEINRGDIPRIFGELLTLLEKDKRGLEITLPLSGDRFTVPQNVHLIGTMNTADRSIALLDTALRRRFGFVELMPDISVLGTASAGGSVPLGLWLAALNDRLRAHSAARPWADADRPGKLRACNPNLYCALTDVQSVGDSCWCIAPNGQSLMGVAR